MVEEKNQVLRTFVNTGSFEPLLAGRAGEGVEPATSEEDRKGPAQRAALERSYFGAGSV